MDQDQVAEAIEEDRQENGQAPPNGVLVVRDYDEQTGKFKVGVQLLGDVKLTEVTTILKKALKEAEATVLAD